MFLPADRKPRTRNSYFWWQGWGGGVGWGGVGWGGVGWGGVGWGGVGWGGVGWGGVGQDVTVMWTSAHLWCYATEIFSRLSYILDATLQMEPNATHLLQRNITFCTSLWNTIRASLSRHSGAKGKCWNVIPVPLMLLGNCAKALFQIPWVLSTRIFSCTAECGNGVTSFITKM